MLVLTRKLGEAVYVGPDVEIFVVAVGSGKVRLGFRAPREVVIQRAEVAVHGATRESDTLLKRPAPVGIERSDLMAYPPLRSFRRLGPV